MIYHLVGHEILNITVHFVFRSNVYFSRKWRKCSQNLEKWKFKNTNLRVKWYIIYHLVGHGILNKTLYFVKRYYSQLLRYLRKCMKKFNIIEWIKMLPHKLRHEYVKRIMIDVIWFIRNYAVHAAVHCSSVLGLFFMLFFRKQFMFFLRF